MAPSSPEPPPPAPDKELCDIADYVLRQPVERREAFETARYCLMDALACAFEALSFPACARLLGPLVPGTRVPGGSRVPGTDLELDPVAAAFGLGCLIRWLDYNDTWLAAEWGHPSDNLGAILSVADYVSRQRAVGGAQGLSMAHVLAALVKAYEIQGVLALENSLNRRGFDHVLLVKVASAAVVTHLMGGGRDQVLSALSNAWVDGPTLRCYRHAPNTGSRKSWAAADAASRAVRLSFLALEGEMGYPTALSDGHWGFYKTFLGGEGLRRSRPYGSYVVENILFKAAFPAEFHAQTAAEAALQLSPRVRDRVGDIREILLTTQEPALRIIHKTGPLRNPADRDHCLQYITAVCLLKGSLDSGDYGEEASRDPRIDGLRAKMTVKEDPEFTRAYYDPARRSVANAVRVRFKDGASTENLVVEYPLGHPRRRGEGLPMVREKFKRGLERVFSGRRLEEILRVFDDPQRLDSLPAHDFMGLLWKG